MQTFETKLGTFKKKPKHRIWIEGRRLIETGFPVGTNYRRVWRDDLRVPALFLVAAPASFVEAERVPAGALAGNDEKTFRVIGKHDKPIIDITGAKVAEFFDGFERVSVQYFARGEHRLALPTIIITGLPA